ncbi:HDOD domain-containing protein [Klenkia terrae]|uniref:HDOD domain-containing protein n=1 Tax=Klenkia terrae TaxID=1052259 RepID=UPI00361047E1
MPGDRALVASDDVVLDDDEVAEPEDGVDDVLLPGATFDAHAVLASIDTMAAQRPVAAQIVALTHADDAGAKDLSRLLAADAALTGRVLKLANSAYYGLRGRVSSLQFAVTVVGFATVRSMATVALTSTDQMTLPAEHWTTSTHLALACSTLAPGWGTAPRTPCAWACWPSWGRPCCTTTTRRATAS